MNSGSASAVLRDASCSTSTVTTTTTVKRRPKLKGEGANGVKGKAGGDMGKVAMYNRASFMNWKVADVVFVATHHWIPCLFAMGLLFFMAVEYTLLMVPSSSPPFDLGFVVTRGLHSLLDSWPELNTLLAGLNTVFVGMQTTYILWTWLIEGRPRATISALFMFTCRGILGYSTQLPLPQDFLGSGADFPVGNVSFFLFFSGHVAGSVIASLDMRRMQRWELAWTFDALNVLQSVRLLVTRGHYTIDLAVGVGAGILFDFLAGKYEESKRKPATGIWNSATKENGST
ncbi:Phosphatidylcholine:diacylglycerol cholinephosphotransferase 1 [Quillaja saponaria]|uniref:Phosphatidylcholine:diacylglycerol cholinephosphotransferase 1 n=1 Tax=Quillaja saponaria TaxID=32244 RepID=A0AAD7PP83_QUISA|nr:Phosphatidylcholine:diacylglycerol cholinephosphotransferase 1 [Quillaja saponaria]